MVTLYPRFLANFNGAFPHDYPLIPMKYRESQWIACVYLSRTGGLINAINTPVDNSAIVHIPSPPVCSLHSLFFRLLSIIFRAIPLVIH